MELAVNRHVKYYERCLIMFPAEAQVYDSSHSSLVFFCLLGQHLLEQSLDTKMISNYIDSLALPGGFRGSASHTLPGPSRFDPPTLSSTFFAICSIGLAQDAAALRRIDKNAVHSYIKSCQSATGAFKNVAAPRFGEASVRHLFTGVAILSLLGIRDVELQTAAVNYIIQCQNPDGGFGETPSASESHAGLTYCCVASLKLMGETLPEPVKRRALGWLAHRQQPSGGFNGRTNKPEDTCYAFWVSATLALLGHTDFIDKSAAQRFLLTECQDELIGGFVKTKGGRADPLHSCLGLCALRLWTSDDLDAAFCLPRRTVEFIKAAR